jgi:hypothetical protein
MYQTAVKIVETGEILISKSNHDYVSVKTPSGKTYYLDGGPGEFIRHGGDAAIISLFLNPKSTIEEIANKAVWGTLGKTGKKKREFVLLCECDTDHLQAILDTQTISDHYKQAIEFILKKRKK